MATIAYGIEVLEKAHLENFILMEQMGLGTINPIDAKHRARYTRQTVEHALRDVYDSYTEAKDNAELADLKATVYAQWEDLDKLADKLTRDKILSKATESCENELS